MEKFLANKRISVIEHPPCALMGTHFQSEDEVKAKTAKLLKIVTNGELHGALLGTKEGTYAVVYK